MALLKGYDYMIKTGESVLTQKQIAFLNEIASEKSCEYVPCSLPVLHNPVPVEVRSTILHIPDHIFQKVGVKYVQ